MFYKEGLFLTRAYDEEGNEGAVGDYLIEKVSDANRVYAHLVTEGGVSYYKTLSGDYLSKGPDGVYGTSDDGMPKTMTELYNLCEYMATETNVAPFLFFGSKGESYVRQALAQVAATANGYLGVTFSKLDLFKKHFFDGEKSDFFLEEIEIRNKKLDAERIRKIIEDRV